MILKDILGQNQCCGTVPVMIYRGSSSDFGKVSIPAPVPDPDNM
jgi:hypothetical protein